MSRIIDVHHHWLPAHQAQDLSRVALPGQTVRELRPGTMGLFDGDSMLFSCNEQISSVDRLMANLDRCGIDKALLSVSNWLEWLDLEMCREVNDAMHELKRRLPERVLTLAHVPLGEPGALDRVIACVRQVLRQVSPGTPVKMTIEPHFGNVLQQAEDFDRVLGTIDDPRLGVCVDTGHFHSAGVDNIAFIRRHARRLCSVHLKDHQGTVSVGIGRGEIDLAAIVAALREAGYDRGLTVELEVEDPRNLPRYTQEAYVYLSGLLGQKL